MARTREWIIGGGLMLGTLGLGLVLAEVGLAILGRPFKGLEVATEGAVAQFDPQLGWSYLPAHGAIQEFASDHRKIALYTDSFGSRVEALGVERDTTQPSALFVGCSFTMGHGVSAEDTLPGQLARSPGFPLQTVNFGVQGYGTDQALLMLQRHLDRFDTKVVVYGFICDHLNRNAYDDRRILLPALVFPGTKPTFELDDGQLVQTTRPQRFTEMFDSRLRGLTRLLWRQYGPPPTLDLTRALVVEMDRVARAQGVPLIVVDWRMDDQSTSCPAGTFDGLGLQVVDALQDAPSDWASWMLPGDAHPDARNHHRIAALVLERMQKLRLVGPELHIATATVAAAAIAR